MVTDTTQYLPAEVIERHGIHSVSLYVNWDGKTDREIDLPDYDGYYDFLKSAGELPTTSQPSVGDFLEVYEPLIEEGADIVSLHLSGGISGTVRSAEQARDQLIERGAAPERITIVDSQSVCAGLGLMALAAANAAADGADAAGATAAARAGMRVLTVELDGKPILADLVGEVPHLALSAQLALEEYLREHGFGRVAKRLASSGVIDVVSLIILPITLASTAPADAIKVVDDEGDGRAPAGDGAVVDVHSVPKIVPLTDRINWNKVNLGLAILGVTAVVAIYLNSGQVRRYARH